MFLRISWAKRGGDIPEAQLIDTLLIDTRVSGTFKLYWQPHVRVQKEPVLSSCRRWARRLAGLSPILHCRLGPELRQEGRPGQWLNGSGPQSSITREIGPGPPSLSERWKNTQDPTDMTSISSTSKRKRRGGRGSVEGDRNNCLLGLPPKLSAWALGRLWPSSLFLHPLLSWMSVYWVTKAILVSITWSFSALPARLHCLHHTFQSQMKGIFTHQTKHREMSEWLF